MKIQNLLGIFAVLLIALSGPSYASGHGSPGVSMPKPPTTNPNTIPPNLPNINIITNSTRPISNLGWRNTVNDEVKIQGAQIGKIMVTGLVSSIFQRVILEMGNGNIIKKKKIIFDAKKEELGNDWVDTLVFFIENRGPVDHVNGNPALFIKKAAKQSENKLREVILKLLEELYYLEQKNECLISCQLSNNAKLAELISSQKKLSNSLKSAGITLDKRLTRCPCKAPKFWLATERQAGRTPVAP